MKKLNQFVEQLRQSLGANQATLLLYSGANAQRQAQLFSVGDAKPAPEFTALDSAEHLINGALSSHKVEMFRSADPDCHLICIPTQERPRNADSTERRQHGINEPGYWLALRGVTDEAQMQAQFEMVGSTVRLAAELFSLSVWRADPETGLPDRGEYERTVELHLKTVGSHGLDLGLLLLQPKAFGQQTGDELLNRARTLLAPLLRNSDQLYRYSDSVLALPIPGADEVGVQALCDKLINALTALESGLCWSVVSLHCGAEQAAAVRSIDCARRLEVALRRCQILPGNQRAFISDNMLMEPATDGQLEGIFTGDAVRDYRNMRLLWEVVEQIGSRANAAELSIDIVALISAALDMPVSLFEQNADQELTLLASCRDLPDHSAALEQLALEAASAKHSACATIHGLTCFAFPARTTLTAPLVLIIADKGDALEQSDQRLLGNLIAQLGRAIERLKVNEQESGLRESEARALRQQVTALSQQASRPDPVFASPAMQQILRRAESWSPTDETILITGESGAGKEIMAARLHQLSSRAHAPMVTVDCASIPGTLLEAELFGKVKGAYTGADSASQGYARKAEGGTLFLDEIGELPIDVQAKLLRFVQEKQVSPVGSTDVYQVDVRIIAATNRNLGEEVTAGRFRGDLMYRLQVLELHLPPLRERTLDIPPLAQYFLDLYNQQYERNCTLSPAATVRLTSYGWPGNVRELKHSMLKACLECTDELITPSDIGFSESLDQRTTDYANQGPTRLGPGSPKPTGPETNGHADLTTPAEQADSLSHSWEVLHESLSQSCSAAVREQLRLPFGTWVTEALVRTADDQSQGVAKHGAALLGMPESTYRRQLERIRQSDQSGLAVQHPLFEPNVPHLITLLRLATAADASPNDSNGSADNGQSLVEAARTMLLGIVAALLPDRSSFGAALMGVTPPTYRRHLQELQERTP